LTICPDDYTQLRMINRGAKDTLLRLSKGFLVVAVTGPLTAKVQHPYPDQRLCVWPVAEVQCGNSACLESVRGGVG